MTPGTPANLHVMPAGTGPRARPPPPRLRRRHRLTRSLLCRRVAVTRARTIGVVALLGALAWALAGRGLVNYDTLYAVVWGRDIAHGTLPDYDVALAPTPHPLATLGGVVLTPFSAAADRGVHGEPAATMVLVGAFAALGARAYVDIPYVALVLGALLVETKRPRAGAPVLALLAVAGLLRPEAWLFSPVYLTWGWRGPRSRPP